MILVLLIDAIEMDREIRVQILEQDCLHFS